jgi:hypothetical protein
MTWANLANTTYQQSWSDTATNYCQTINTPDCSCINRNDNQFYEIIADDLGSRPNTVAGTCWWRPCQNPEEFLVLPAVQQTTCPQDTCVVVNSIVAQTILSPFIDVGNQSTCSSTPPAKVYIEEIALAVVVVIIVIVIAALIVFYTTKSKSPDALTPTS